MKIWGKTVLSCYRYLETVIEALENLALKISTNSIHTSSGRYKDALSIMNNIIEITERKRLLINLKIIVEECLVGLNEQDRRMLILSYLDGVNYNKIVELMGISLRTYFRKKAKAMNAFASQLKIKGYDEKYLKKNYSSEKWLLDFYTYNNSAKMKLETIDEEEGDMSKGRIIHNILRDLKKCAI